MQSYILGWLKLHTWALEVTAGLILLLCINFGLKKLFMFRKRVTHLKETDWRYHLDSAALIPAQVILWILLVSFLADLFIRETCGANSSLPIAQLRNTGLVLVLAWFLLRWKKVVQKTMGQQQTSGKQTFDPLSLQIGGRLISMVILFLTTLIILQILGIDIIPLIAFGGIGAAALGFASKDVVANFFGGVMLSFTRPFTVGDLIELPQKGVRGRIEEIGWYLTSLRDLQKRPLYVPNWLFATELLVNESRMSHRCLQGSFFMRLEDVDKVADFVAGVKSYLASHVAVDQSLSHSIHLEGFETASLRFELRAYLVTTDWDHYLEARQEILLEIEKIMARLGGGISTPTLQVQIKN